MQSSRMDCHSLVESYLKLLLLALFVPCRRSGRIDRPMARIESGHVKVLHIISKFDPQRLLGRESSVAFPNERGHADDSTLTNICVPVPNSF